MFINKYIKSLYKHSPIFLQNFGFSLGGLKLYNLRKMNKYYKRYLKSLNESQWYKKEDLEILKTKNLKNIISHAYKYVPYYHKTFRSLNIYPENIKCVDDLKELPIITKETVKKNWNDFISIKYSRWEKILATTGGSTGSPLHIIWGKDSFVRERCFEARHWNWGQVKPGDKLAHFGSSTFLIPESQKSPPFWRYCMPEKMIYFSPFHLSDEFFPYYTAKLKKFNPTVFRGHPTKIYLIARFIDKNHITGINPKAVFTSSEMLIPSHRRKIEDIFGCKVYDYYGNNEHVSYISQCEKGSYHINEEYGSIELLKNDEIVNTGEMGEMVCTGFINNAMPLIRYKMEDLAVLSDTKCECGRMLPVINSIKGRSCDIVTTSDGRYLTTEAIVEGIDTFQSIKEWQLIQESKNFYVINCVIDHEYKYETDLKKLEEIVRRRIGKGKININMVDSIKRRGNKFRTVISKVNI